MPAHTYAAMRPGGCRLNNKKDKGVEFRDYFHVEVSSKAECKSWCDESPKCVAVEVTMSGGTCKLWVNLPKFTSGSVTTALSCHRKLPPLEG